MRRPRWMTGFGGFLLALLGLLVLQPIIAHFGIDAALFELVVVATLAAGTLGVRRGRKPRLVIVVLAALTVMARVGGMAGRSVVVAEVGDLGALFFFVYVASVVLHAVVTEPEVTVDTLYGGVAVYLLAALAWGIAFQILERHVPGSFLESGQPVVATGVRGSANFVYYSFVTIASLGYGDIVPANPIARVLAVVEVVFGQLYVAMLIGRLMGLHLQSRGT